MNIIKGYQTDYNKVFVVKYIIRKLKSRPTSDIFHFMLNNWFNNNVKLIKFVGNNFIRFDNAFTNYEYLNSFTSALAHTCTTINDANNDKLLLIDYLYEKIQLSYTQSEKYKLKNMTPCANITGWLPKEIEYYFQKFSKKDDINFFVYANKTVWYFKTKCYEINKENCMCKVTPIMIICMKYFSSHYENTKNFSNEIEIFYKNGAIINYDILTDLFLHYGCANDEHYNNYINILKQHFL